jgi:hypothetical protein
MQRNSISEWQLLITALVLSFPNLEPDRSKVLQVEGKEVEKTTILPDLVHCSLLYMFPQPTPIELQPAIMDQLSNGTC